MASNECLNKIVKVVKRVINTTNSLSDIVVSSNKSKH